MKGGREGRESDGDDKVRVLERSQIRSRMMVQESMDTGVLIDYFNVYQELGRLETELAGEEKGRGNK